MDQSQILIGITNLKDASHTAPSDVCRCHKELGLNFINCFLAYLEGLCKYIIKDWRCRSKDSIANSDNTRVLAAERGNGHRIGGPVVVLVVYETLREHKHITLVKNLGVVLVLRV